MLISAFGKLPKYVSKNNPTFRQADQDFFRIDGMGLKQNLIESIRRSC